MNGSQQDTLAIAQNGGLSGQEIDDGDLDGETEVDMDDDMMDKISSSPSIEDGGSIFTLPCIEPGRAEVSSRGQASPCSPWASSVVSDARSSSPYLEHPEYLPLSRQAAHEKHPAINEQGRHHHHDLDGELEAQDAVGDQEWKDCSNNSRNGTELIEHDMGTAYKEEFDVSHIFSYGPDKRETR